MQMRLLLLLILILTIQCGQFSQTPNKYFSAFPDFTKIKDGITMLSTDTNQMILSYQETTSQSWTYKILDFDGQQLCKRVQTDESAKLLYWPAKSGPMFVDNKGTTITRLPVACGDLQNFTTLSAPVTVNSFISSGQKSYASFLIDKTISQYSVSEHKIIKNYTIDSSAVATIKYSSSHEYICALVGVTQNSYKVFGFNTESGKKQFEINNQAFPIFVFQDGSYVGQIKDKQIVKISRDGTSKNIVDISQNTQQATICSGSKLLVLLMKSGQNYSIVTYDLNDDFSSQNFKLAFKPANTLLCHDNALVIMGTDGYMRIFNYFDPESNVSFSLPWWAYAIIGGVVIIVFIVAEIIRYRRYSKRYDQKQDKKKQKDSQITTDDQINSKEQKQKQEEEKKSQKQKDSSKKKKQQQQQKLSFCQFFVGQGRRLIDYCKNSKLIQNCIKTKGEGIKKKLIQH